MICNKISHSSSNKGAILKFYSCLLISLIFCLFIQNSSRAESLKNKEPIIFTADEVTNDDENNIIKAHGNVEISFEDILSEPLETIEKISQMTGVNLEVSNPPNRSRANLPSPFREHYASRFMTS